MYYFKLYTSIETRSVFEIYPKILELLKYFKFTVLENVYCPRINTGSMELDGNLFGQK